MKLLVTLLVTACLLLGAALPAASGVQVQRSGSENPMVEVAKSTFYGGLAGLLLGSAVALANDSKNSGDIIKWGFVGGTFFGFGYGLYHVSKRPSAMLEIEDGGVRLGAVVPTWDPVRGVRVSLVAARF